MSSLNTVGLRQPRSMKATLAGGLLAVGALVGCEEALVYDAETGFQDLELVSGMMPDTVLVGVAAPATAALVFTSDNAVVSAGGPPIEWTSSDTSIIRVTGSGDSVQVTARRPGVATVSARVDERPYRPQSVQQTVTVLLAGVDLATGDTLLTALGDTVHAFASGLGVGTTVSASGLTWERRGDGVVTLAVEATGDRATIVATGNGTDTIFVRHSACQGSCEEMLVVTVAQEASAVRMSADTMQFASLGAQRSALAEVVDRRGNPIDGAVAVFSLQTEADSSIVELDASGTITARANGQASVIAAYGPLSAQLQVTVHQSIASIELVPAAIEFTAIGSRDTVSAQVLDPGGSPLERPYSLEWSVDDASVATIAALAGDSTRAEVTAVDLGTAVVRAQADEVTGSGAVTVSPTEVVITPATDSIFSLNGTLQLSASALDENGAPLTAEYAWSSLDEATASVDADGLVTGLANGTAPIVARVGARADTAQIVVRQKVATITLAPQEVSRPVGDTIHFTAVPRDAGGTLVTGQTLEWWTTDSSTVSLAVANDSQAVATAISVGSAQVMVGAASVSASASLSVTLFAADACEQSGGTAHSGTITSSETWAASGNPHKVSGSFNTEGSAILSVEPGSLVCMDPGATLSFQSGGRLDAVGTPDEPVVFTRTGTSGAWNGLAFSGSPAGQSVLRHAWIEHASTGVGTSGNHVLNVDTVLVRNATSYGFFVGSRGTRLTGLEVLAGPNVGVRLAADTTILELSHVRGAGTGVQITAMAVTLQDVVIEGSAGTGLSQSGGDVVLQDVRIIGSGGVGISGSGTLASASGIRVTGGSSYPFSGSVQMLAVIAPTASAVDSLAGNANDSVYVSGGTVDADDTLHIGPAYPLGIISGFAVEGLLRVDPGATLEFPGGHSISFVGGRFVALGTAAAPIRFRATDPANRWSGLRMYGAPADTSRLAHVVFSDVSSTEGAIYSFGSHPVVIDSATIRQSTFVALRLESAGSAFRGSAVDTTHTSTEYAVRVTGNTTLQDVVVRGAAGTGLTIAGTDVALDGVRIDGSNGLGISMGSNATLSSASGVRVVNGGSYPARLPIHGLASLAPTAADQDSLRGNARDTLLINGGTLAGDTLTALTSLPWIMEAGFVVDAGALLVIEPATRFAFPAYAGVTFQNGGLLDARGTAESPILFTRAQGITDPWYGLGFYGTPTDTSRLTNVVVEYAGEGYWANGEYASIAALESHPVVLDSVLVRQSRRAGVGLGSTGSRLMRSTVDTTGTTNQTAAGVMVFGTGITVDEVTVRRGGNGLWTDSNADNLVLRDIRLEDSRIEGLWLHAGATLTEASGLRIVDGDSIVGRMGLQHLAQIAGTPALQDSLTGNARDVIWLGSSTLTADTVHLGTGLGWRLLGTQAIDADALVKMDPGTRVEANAYTGWTFQNGGLLDARGTATSPIVFTRTEGITDPWYGLGFYGTPTDTSRLTNVVVEYAGEGYWANGEYASIAALESHPVLLDSVLVRQSRRAGVGLGSTGSRLMRSTVDTTGTTNATAPGVMVFGTGITVDEVTVRRAYNGLWTDSNADDLVLRDLRLEDSRGIGIFLAQGSTLLEASGVRVVDGDTSAAWMGLQHLAQVAGTPALQDSLTGNARNEVWLHFSTLTADTVHFGAALLWRAGNTLTVDTDALVKLDPGVRIEAGGYAGWTFQNGGLLDARGTAASPIVFTRAEGVTDPWYGLGFYGTPTDTSRLTNVIVEYAGQGHWATFDHAAVAALESHPVVLDSVLVRQSRTVGVALGSSGSRLMRSTVDTTGTNNGTSAGVLIFGTDNRLEHTTVRGAAGDGVRFQGSNSAVLVSCAVTGSGGDGVDHSVGSGTSISSCNLESNAGLGVNNGTGALLPAENNWWGDAAGPNGANGDGVSADVDFEPFLTAPATVESYRP